eukprot:TRINITY_DN19489_c0_g3_i3.p1 TRINITY_DN19489_c0_g3~~TRINITY_DN19489_c0_g3_i3.p1  ORF type:complete len:291 (+),score=44.85 TRINITY_DN19489_c0_g3_i3:64-936(+)
MTYLNDEALASLEHAEMASDDLGAYRTLTPTVSSASSKAVKVPSTLFVFVKSCEITPGLGGVVETPYNRYTVRVQFKHEVVLTSPLTEGRLVPKQEGKVVKLTWNGMNTFSKKVMYSAQGKLKPTVTLAFELLSYNMVEKCYLTVAKNNVVLEAYHPTRRKGKVTLSPNVTCIIEVWFSSAGTGNAAFESVSNMTVSDLLTEIHNPISTHEDPSARVRQLEATLKRQYHHIRDLERENEAVNQRLRDRSEEAHSLRKSLYSRSRRYEQQQQQPQPGQTLREAPHCACAVS